MEDSITNNPNFVWMLLGLIVVIALALKLYFRRTSKKLKKRASRPSI